MSTRFELTQAAGTALGHLTDANLIALDRHPHRRRIVNDLARWVLPHWRNAAAINAYVAARLVRCIRCGEVLTPENEPHDHSLCGYCNYVADKERDR